MKKKALKLLSVLACLALSAGVAACGSADDDNDGSSSVSQSSVWFSSYENPWNSYEYPSWWNSYVSSPSGNGSSSVETNSSSSFGESGSEDFSGEEGENSSSVSSESVNSETASSNVNSESANSNASSETASSVTSWESNSESVSGESSLGNSESSSEPVLQEEAYHFAIIYKDGTPAVGYRVQLAKDMVCYMPSGETDANGVISITQNSLCCPQPAVYEVFVINSNNESVELVQTVYTPAEFSEEFIVIMIDAYGEENPGGGGSGIVSSESNSEGESSGSWGESSEEVIDPNATTETRPLIIGMNPLDGNFNPFFATNANDLEVLSMTQIGMLDVDEEGNLVCGQDYPTVAESYTMTVASDDAYTDYSFVIKDGIMFSDGTPLTIDDVLFNLYVYLDPAYRGPSTLYSVDIVGLAAYQAQDLSLLESDSGFNQSIINAVFYQEADTRIDNIIEYLSTDSDYEPSDDELINIYEDIAKLKALFKDEVTSDWVKFAGELRNYEQEYAFTEDWEIYFFEEELASLVTARTETGYRYLKDINGKYVTTLTRPGVVLEDGTTYDGTYQGKRYYADHLVEAIENAAKDETKIAAKMAELDCTREEAIEYVIQDQAIQMVYAAYTTDAYIEQILLYWESGEQLREELMAQARTEYYDELLADGMMVESVMGITTSKTADGKDVLNIRINGVDPKAIYEFDFTVAPKHYYSNELTIETTRFGVKWNDYNFFNDVLQTPEKNSLPMGAGAYKATDINGADNVSRDSFYKNNYVYFKRNDYFETVGSGLNNAKIKYIRYKVINSDQIVPALHAGVIDIGEPNATPQSIAELAQAGLRYKTSATNGYGYVGINPEYVPDIEVRRAIMYAMDTSLTISYYAGDLAELVFRPMSLESWAYPEYADFYYNPGEAEEMIPQLLDEAGWVMGSDGIRYKEGKKLELTFTIAGGTTDHPAYDMFNAAETILEKYGFEITVQRDPSAMMKLATGGRLAVWAAEWGSEIDPDMYQKYHKDSKAYVTKNWGYDTIFADQSGELFFEEQKIIEELSKLIDDARETTTQSVRKDIYADALDLVMKLAVELPTYQRNDCVAYTSVIDANSLNRYPTAYVGVLDRIWEVDYVE